MQIKLVESHKESLVEPPDLGDGAARLTLWAELPPLHQDISHIKQRSEGDLAFCLPIFQYTPKHGKTRQHIAQVGYMKRIFWLAYELLHFTDSQDTETGFYIVCEDTLRPLIEPYRQLCNFPEELILTVPTDALGLLKKIAFLNQLAKRTDFKYYMSLDLSITFYNQSHFCQELLDSWEKSDVDTIFQAKKGIWDAKHIFEYNKGTPVTYLFAGFDPKIPKERFYRELPRFFGYNFYEDYLRHVYKPHVPVPGWLYGLSKKHILSPEFQEFFDFATGNGNINQSLLCSDEAFLVLYWWKYLSPEKKFISAPEVLYNFGGNMALLEQVGSICRISHITQKTDEFHEFYLNYYRDLNP